MSWNRHAGNVLIERGDDTARTVTTYDATGAVTSTRPYTAAENAAADSAAVEAQRNATRTNLTATARLQARLGRLARYNTDTEIVAALGRTDTTAPTTQELNRLLKAMLRREERLSATIALLVRLIDPALLADVSDATDA